MIMQTHAIRVTNGHVCLTAKAEENISYEYRYLYNLY